MIFNELEKAQQDRAVKITDLLLYANALTVNYFTFNDIDRSLLEKIHSSLTVYVLWGRQQDTFIKFKDIVRSKKVTNDH